MLMKKQSKFKISWQKVALVSSVILNLVFITGFVVTQALAPKTAIAQLNFTNRYFCEDMYDNIISQFDSDETKAIYAMTACLRNYKNGQSLDLSPLMRQINETSPVTNHGLDE